MGAFNKLFGRLRLTSDVNVATQTTTVIQTDTTNSNLAIVPNGTGAITAAIPDGTVTGGNARGNNAVDLQQSRSAAGQVASSNYSFVGGGQNNSTTSGDHYQVVVGGLSNSINASGHSFIGGGQSNSIATGSGSGWSVVTGGRGNVVSSQYSTVSGGQSNTASTNSHATVVGGLSNVSSGQYSVSGGNRNTASGTGSFCFGSTSNGNTASGVGAFNFNGQPEGSTVSGNYGINLSGGATTISGEGGLSSGYNNQVSSAYGIATGLQSVSYLFCQESRANGKFVLLGDAQVSQLVARKSDTLLTAATTVLSLDGTGTTNLIIPTGTNRMWNVTIKYVAVVTTITGTATGVTVGDTKSQNIEIGFKKVGGVSSLVGSGVYSIPQEDASMGTASLTPTAGASQELALTFTAPTFSGGGSVTCRVVAKVELVEVAY
jgi:hypothetical protein